MRKLKGVISGKELLKSLSPETREAIEKIPEENGKILQKGGRRAKEA